jgi:hypothetical protein
MKIAEVSENTVFPWIHLLKKNLLVASIKYSDTA